MSDLVGDLAPAVAALPTANDAWSKPGRQALARLWAPWASLLVLAALAWIAAGWCVVRWFEAWRELADRRATIAAVGTSSQPGLALVDPDGPAMSAAALLEHRPQDEVGDASHLLEQVEALSAEAGVSLLQFIPQPTPSAKDPTIAVRLQLQGPADALEALLLALGDPAPAVELTSLRLAGGPLAGVLVCDLGVNLRDAASLVRLGAAGPMPVRADRSDNSALIPGVAFASPSTLHLPALARPGAGAMPAAPGPVGAAGGAGQDPLAGVRLLGVLQAGERVAVLLDLPGTGALLLRRSERLGPTRFRLENAADGRASLVGDGGERRVLGLQNESAGLP